MAFTQGSFYHNGHECRRLIRPIRITFRPAGTPELANVARLTSEGAVLLFLDEDECVAARPPDQFKSYRHLIDSSGFAPLAASVFEWQGDRRNTRMQSICWHSGPVMLIERGAMLLPA